MRKFFAACRRNIIELYNWKRFAIVKKITGFGLLVLGVIFFVTPFTPGAVILLLSGYALLEWQPPKLLEQMKNFDPRSRLPK